MMYFFCFFCKQKTAYEMRISDWSSDVCSSDLRARPDFFRNVDAANVDLKAFTERFYRDVTKSRLQPVLDTLVYLARETAVWLEITNLVIPGENDGEAEIDAMTGWIVEHLGPDVPVHFSAFHPDYRMLDRQCTPPRSEEPTSELQSLMRI